MLYLGRAPRTKETLPDFLKWRRVTRRPLVFRGLTGSQRTPGFWGVTVIPGSPELGPTDQTEPAGVARIESKEADPVPSALHVIPPSDRDEGQPSKSNFMRSGLPRPPFPERIITNCYSPPRGPEPPRVEVSAPGRTR